MRSFSAMVTGATVRHDAGEPEIVAVTPVELVDHRMVLREPGKCRIGKHQRAVEDLVGMNDGRHEALNVAAVEDGFFLLGRMLVRMHRKDVGDARQILRPLIDRDRRQLEDLCFIRRDVFRRCREVRRGFQPGFFHRQTIIVFVGACFWIGQQDDIVGVGEGEYSAAGPLMSIMFRDRVANWSVSTTATFLSARVGRRRRGR